MREKIKTPHRPKVLIFEDELLLTDLCSIKFKEAGFEVKGFTTYENVVEIVAREEPDIIYCDILMPKSLNGWEAIKLLKNDERTKNIPIIIVDNMCSKEEIQKGLNAGADYHCCKAEKTLVEVVEIFKNHLIKTAKFNNKDFT